MKRAETSALFYFFITKWNYLGIMYNEGINRKGVSTDFQARITASEHNQHLKIMHMKNYMTQLIGMQKYAHLQVVPLIIKK